MHREGSPEGSQPERGHSHPHTGERGRGPIQVEVDHQLMEENDREARALRRLLRDNGVLALNLMSSPGAGKTTLLEKTLSRLPKTVRSAVVEGDIETAADADRLAPLGVPIVQINTGPFGGDCHLAAPLIGNALRSLDLESLDLIFIENVGNLVCPAEFDVGEDHKVVLLSLPEGEDKPLKYPLMFHESSLALITKADLLPHLHVDPEMVTANMKRTNPDLETILLSAQSGRGLESWMNWLLLRMKEKR